MLKIDDVKKNYETHKGRIMTEEENKAFSSLKIVQSFRQPENGRKDRTWNIAVALLHHFWDQNKPSWVYSSDIRKEIREAIQATPYSDYDVPGGKLGDLRAHGDAVGGHGLNLDVDFEIGGSDKHILLNECNYNIILDRLNLTPEKLENRIKVIINCEKQA
jgi:hypothetical protein